MTSHKKSNSLCVTAAILISCFAIVGEVQGKGGKNPSNAAISVKQVNPRAIGYQTTETGGWDEFQVVLKSQPTDTVSISLYSDDTSEGIIDRDELVFTPANWDIPQVVWIVGIDDDDEDGNVEYTIVLERALSANDPNYDGLDPEDVHVTNIDDEKTPQANVLYVSYLDIADQRQRGRSSDVCFVVDVEYDDGTPNGIAAAGVNVVISVYDSSQTDLKTNSNIRNSLVMTDSNGQIVTPWLKGLGSADYRVEVHDMWLENDPYLWDPLDLLDVGDDEDSDGRPDFVFTID